MERRARTAARLRERGQLTVPAEIRRRAHLEEGTVVEFEIREDGVVLRPTLVVDDLELDDEFVRDVIESTTTAYAELREDEAAWDDELRERAVLEGSLADGLEQ